MSTRAWPIHERWLTSQTEDDDTPVIFVERKHPITDETYAHVLFEADWAEDEVAEHVASLHNRWLDQRLEREHLDAARRRIEGVKSELQRWDWVKLQSSQTTFASQIRKLDEALAMLDPEVKLA